MRSSATSNTVTLRFLKWLNPSRKTSSSDCVQCARFGLRCSQPLAFTSYLLFTWVDREDREPNPTLSLILIVIGVSATLISFVIKSKLITLAIEQQRIQLVQQAYIVAWAMTEVAALLGMLDFFATGHRHYYILFIIAALGMLLHDSTTRTCRKRLAQNSDLVAPIKNATR